MGEEVSKSQAKYIWTNKKWFKRETINRNSGNCLPKKCKFVVAEIDINIMVFTWGQKVRAVFFFFNKNWLKKKEEFHWLVSVSETLKSDYMRKIYNKSLSNKKGQMLYGFIDMNCPEQANPYSQNIDSCFLGVGMGDGKLLLVGIWLCRQGNKNSLLLDSGNCCTTLWIYQKTLSWIS